MCFRLLAATRDADVAAIERLAFECGLDVRVAPKDATHFVEIAWGDCACSLYTRREGTQRVSQLVQGLLARANEVQLLLLVDGQPVSPDSGEPAELPLEVLEREGLAALPEGSVVRVTPGERSASGADSR